ncbi:ribosomal protein L12E-L44-L45-RPP1-RPP2 [Enterocytozoon bieneusi H348]|nr:ribosomal protein L12E-L44-L45-RPP1-RPP2 [Enterocytozoon bieneusi H348]|eukprot:XP_001828072.1 ribosomal protein L12E-L44-L45-RPP1-RPP2 [Enterocytozoon bieneusi H348]
MVNLKICRTCLSNEIVILSHSIYCKVCNVYYHVESENQYVSSIPVKEFNCLSITLCIQCKSSINENRIISCVNYIDFLHKLHLCSNCKKTNENFLLNLYYRNFITYKKIKKTYNIWYKIIYCIIGILGLLQHEYVIPFVITKISYYISNIESKHSSKAISFLIHWSNISITKINNVEKYLANQNNLLFKTILNYSNKPIIEKYKQLIVTQYNKTIYILTEYSYNLHNILRQNYTNDKLAFINEIFVIKKIRYIYNLYFQLIANWIISLILTVCSVRYFMYCWWYWLDFQNISIIKTIIFIFFAMNRFIVVDLLLFLKNLIYINNSIKIVYEIPEKLTNRSEEIKNGLKKLTFKK